MDKEPIPIKMVISIEVNSKMEKDMDKELLFLLLEQKMKVNFRMVN